MSQNNSKTAKNRYKKSGHLIGNRFTFNKYHPKIYELLSPNTSSKITTIQSVMVVLNTYLVIGEKRGDKDFIFICYI